MRFKDAVDELDVAIVLDKVALPLELVLDDEDPDMVELVLAPAEVVSARLEALETGTLETVGYERLLVVVESAGVVAAGLLDDEPVPCRGKRTLKSSIPPTGACCTRGLPSPS